VRVDRASQLDQEGIIISRNQRYFIKDLAVRTEIISIFARARKLDQDVVGIPRQPARTSETYVSRWGLAEIEEALGSREPEWLTFNAPMVRTDTPMCHVNSTGFSGSHYLDAGIFDRDLGVEGIIEYDFVFSFFVHGFFTSYSLADFVSKRGRMSF
jgi:hypothetical protein